jgi:hypothetical protein
VKRQSAATLCHQAAVEGVRADLVMGGLATAARAHPDSENIEATPYKKVLTCSVAPEKSAVGRGVSLSRASAQGLAAERPQTLQKTGL